ncbi:MAG: DUF2863 family protein [Lautropia sp.]|nr:DUF2863 family protein [Lautropia sp.]
MSSKELRISRRSRDRTTQLSPDADAMVAASLGLANSGSRSEDRFWEHQLTRVLDRALDAAHSATITTALERLNQTDGEAYGALVEAVEHAAETVVLDPVVPAATNGSPRTAHNGLLLTAPLVAWTRFAIPSGAVTPQVAQALSRTWQELILAPSVVFRMVPWLYSLDQLPREFSDMRKLTRKLTAAAVTDGIPRIDFKNMPESAEMLADTRFLLAVVSVDDPLKPLFRWQLQGPSHAARVLCLEQWVEHARPLLEPLLPGCGFECLLPDAYHINLRESDRRVRAYGIKAAVHFLNHALAIDASQIKATIGAFGAERIDEYRIGLSVGDADEVAQGVVWPLLGAESETDEPTPLERIKETLREVGVQEIAVWSEVTEPEFCEDCGAPLYPSPSDEVVHVEMPEDTEPASTQFH